MTAIAIALVLTAVSFGWLRAAPHLPRLVYLVGLGVLVAGLVAGVYVSLTAGMASAASGVVSGLVLGGTLGWFTRPEPYVYSKA